MIKKTKKEIKNSEELCCDGLDNCSTNCNPKPKKKELKCTCGGCCG